MLNKKVLFAIFLIAIIICANYSFATEYDNYEAYNLYSEVIKAGVKEEYNDGYTTYLVQKIRVRILDEKFKDQEYDILYYLEDGINSNLPLYDEFKVGDRLYVYGIYEDGILTVDAASYYDKTPWVIGIFAIFAILILVIGGKNGIKALVSLLITVLVIFGVLVPAILEGKDPIVLTVLICSFIIIVTFIIISGIKKKTLVAIIGTVAGVVAAAIIGAIFSNAMRLTGINEHARMISTIVTQTISFKNIMLSGIMISALGACMDVGMSIASALSELKLKKPDMSSKELIKSGMNIGKDVMGTMTNTLILAYVGSAILCILLYNANGFDFSFIINAEDITDEILKSLAGSIGLVCTIPFTAILGGMIIGNEKIKKEIKEEKEEKEIPVNYFKG